MRSGCALFEEAGVDEVANFMRVEFNEVACGDKFIIFVGFCDYVND